MNAESFGELLARLKACSEAIAWAKGKSLEPAWSECANPSWMLWLLGRSQVNKNLIATLAVEFAEMSAHSAKDYPAVAECIKVVKLFIDGKATQEELWSAESAARSAAESAESAARSAARSAAWSAESAESAAWSAARAAARSAAAAAAQKQQCEIIRKHIPATEIIKLFKEVSCSK